MNMMNTDEKKTEEREKTGQKRSNETETKNDTTANEERQRVKKNTLLWDCQVASSLLSVSKIKHCKKLVSMRRKHAHLCVKFNDEQRKNWTKKEKRMKGNES